MKDCMISDKKLMQRVYLAHFHLLMKLLLLLFPCFDDALRQVRPSGNLVIHNMALTEV